MWLDYYIHVVGLDSWANHIDRPVNILFYSILNYRKLKYMHN